MPFDNQRGKTRKDFKFSCILFTGRTIHFIYKWLKITKSKQAEALQFDYFKLGCLEVTPAIKYSSP